MVAASPYGSVAFSLANTATGVPATIAATAVGESAAAGTRFGAPLAVTVLDANGAPVVGATVTFALGAGAAGSGSPSAGATFDGGAAQATALTGENGVATSPNLSANSVAGTYTASAATTGITEPALFALRNLAAPTPAVKPVHGVRSAVAGARYAGPLEVKVVDAKGRPVEGASVAFAFGTGGGGSGAASAGAAFLDGTSQATETTGADGVAVSPAFRANSVAGSFTASATLTGTTRTAVFALRNLAAPTPRLLPLHAGLRSAATGARYAGPLEVKVVDAKGRPVEGASVAFAFGTGGGGSGAASAGAAFLDGTSQATETTGADGVAVSPAFRANSVAGSFTASATLTGTTRTALFALRNDAGAPSRLSPIGRETWSARVGGRYPWPLEARLRDGSGSPEPGVTVTFSLSSAGASGASAAAGAGFLGGTTQATVVTNANGVAVSPRFEANTVTGSFTASATAAGVSQTLIFGLRNLAGRPSSITAGVAATESTTAGSVFPVRLAASVTDTHGNAVKGAVVTFSAPARGPSGRFGSGRTVRVRTDASGVAVAPPFRAGSLPGGYAVTASVRGVSRSAAFGLTNDQPG